MIKSQDSLSPRGLDLIDQPSDTGSFVQTRIMKKVPSHFNSVNNSFTDDTPINRSSIP